METNSKGNKKSLKICRPMNCTLLGTATNGDVNHWVERIVLPNRINKPNERPAFTAFSELTEVTLDQLDSCAGNYVI